MQNADLKERIISVENEGQLFFIYYDGKTHYDEDCYGNKIETENTVYLDENLNTWELNVGKSYVDKMIAEKLEQGVPAFKGPHSPEIPVLVTVTDENGKKYQVERMVPNTDPNTVGIWRLSTKEEKEKYTRILLKQNAERVSLKLAC